ncbi:monovalent cation/H+ antiporter complex subunit F [Canibacter zhoujuaniae]|uniref:monovalent cation/H+ antiporter complex subunit F n=1 Tax=Canibacter zhoujuaniae TaxID=2708343 RepID=UPI001FB8ED09|nr:monovalent cation/H+ antiporter complex subunit F [Canibacter zhoujuaniae]
MLILENTLVWVGAGALAITALCALIRALQGPTILDRLVASDVLLTTIVLAMGAEMVINNHNNSVPVMIGISATAALATVTVSRYVRRANPTTLEKGVSTSQGTESERPATGEIQITHANSEPQTDFTAKKEG